VASPPTRRVVRLVSYLAAHAGHQLTLSEIARGTDTNKATCLAILAELTDAGWVERAGDRPTYTLGEALAALGDAGEAAQPSIRFGRAALAELDRHPDLVCSTLVRPRGRHLVVVDVVGDTSSLGAGSTGGALLPFAPPIGVAVMAWSSPAEIDEWLARSDTPISRSDREWFAANFAHIRRAGYAVTRLDHSASQVQQLLAWLADDPVARSARPALHTVSRRLIRDAQVLDSARRHGRVLVSAVTAPIFDADARPSLIISSRPVRRELTPRQVEAVGRRVLAATRIATLDSGGRLPS
jgi:DNA-binding IclR family transcriptional regulator